MVEHSGCRVWATVSVQPLPVSYQGLCCKEGDQTMISPAVFKPPVYSCFLFVFSKWKSVFRIHSKHCFVYKCVCLEDDAYINFSIYSQAKRKDHSVLRLFSLLHRRLSTDQCRFTKEKKGGGASYRIPLSFLMWLVIGLFGFCVFVFNLVFKSAWQRATPLCCDTVGLWPTSKAMALRWPCP